MDKKTIGNYSLGFTEHAKEQMEKKNFKLEDIEEMFTKPARVYPNKKFEGQFRVAGKGICLVGAVFGSEFRVITMYEDNVMTPPRADQLDNAEGQDYAKRYEAAKAGKRVRRKNEYWGRVHQRNGEMGHTLIK